MAHSYHWETHGLYRRFFAEVSGEEILVSNFELHNQPEFFEIDYIINDFSDITGYKVEKEHTRIYARTDDIISDSKGKLKVAIIVNKAELVSLAENYRSEMKNREFTCEIFATLEAARKWAE